MFRHVESEAAYASGGAGASRANGDCGDSRDCGFYLLFVVGISPKVRWIFRGRNVRAAFSAFHLTAQAGRHGRVRPLHGADGP